MAASFGPLAAAAPAPAPAPAADALVLADIDADAFEAAIHVGAADPACAIKGNINRSGERIYHVPGGPAYDSVRIDEAAGERWFCSEAEAQAAGWRAPG